MDKKEILKKHLDAFCAKDWNTFKALMTDDAVYDEEATRRRVQGTDKIVQLVKTWSDAFPDARVNVKDMVVTGEAVVAELEWSGTQKGALTGPLGTIPPTHKQAKVSAVQVVRFDGDKIREVGHYFDLLTVLTQLGVSPQLGTRPPAP